jgi:hypothetical protein
MVVNGNGSSIIAFRTAVGITNNGNTISGFSLSQNYPNPFNPSTKIIFTINNTEAQDIKLSVYDITGKETEVLLNKKLSAGTYETIWDGSNYSSGIYFYKLETPQYSEARKMMMVK